MGVTTSNRKRPEECMSVNHAISPLPDSQRQKRPKLSPAPTRPVSTSYAVVSRVSRYPEFKPRIVREVHAPCSSRKFDLCRQKSRFAAAADNSNRFTAGDNNHIFRAVENNDRFCAGGNNDRFRTGDGNTDIMGNFLVRKCEKAKLSALAKCERFVSQKWKEQEKEKEVIDVDAESSGDDSGVQEVIEIRDSEPMVVDGGVKRRSTSSPDSALTINNGFLKVMSDGKVSETHDIRSVHVYKKLLEDVRRRTDTIDRLNFQIELNEKLRDTYNLLRPKKELVEEVPCEPFVPLTKEEEAEVARAFSTNRRKILVAHENSNIEISGEKIQCLHPGAWLNDEVINLYLELLKERERREPQKFLKCHFFNTFFYKKLISGRNGYDFKSVRRWTSKRKLGYDLFECDKIFVPIHQEIHWCLAVINTKDAKFQYLDSLKGKDHRVLQVLAKYFVDEVKDKTGKDIDVSTWEKEFVEDLPEQENGFDCGVFMIKYADFYSRGLGLCFNQEHMPYFRLRTAKEILRLKAD